MDKLNLLGRIHALESQVAALEYEVRKKLEFRKFKWVEDKRWVIKWDKNQYLAELSVRKAGSWGNEFEISLVTKRDAAGFRFKEDAEGIAGIVGGTVEEVE